MLKKGHARKYIMSRKAANDTLKNVLAACNIESDNINFDILVFKGMAQTNFVDACKWIAIGFLFLVLIAPAALVNNELKVDPGRIISEHIIIEDHRLYKDHFMLKLVGNDIDYDAIYAKTADGSAVFPSRIDEEDGIVTFDYENEGMTIYIRDKQGHTISASLSRYDSERQPDGEDTD